MRDYFSCVRQVGPMMMEIEATEEIMFHVKHFYLGYSIL